MSHAFQLEATAKKLGSYHSFGVCVSPRVVLGHFGNLGAGPAPSNKHAIGAMVYIANVVPLWVWCGIVERIFGIEPTKSR